MQKNDLIWNNPLLALQIDKKHRLVNFMKFSTNSLDVEIGPISVLLKIYEDNFESIESQSTGKTTVWPTSNWTIDKV